MTHRLGMAAVFVLALAACSSDSNNQASTAESGVLPQGASAKVSEQQAHASAKPVLEFVVSDKPLIVYSARKEHLIKPLFERYTELSGQKIEYVTDKAGPLLARLKAEGENSPADILFTVDAGNLWHAAQTDVLQPLDSAFLQQNVPANLRDPENLWYGLSVRARTIVYASDRVQPQELSSYEALADEQWNKRLCLRTSKKVYNQSLVASLIAAHGVEKTEKIVKGWVANLALDPFSNDTKTLEAVAAGQCDVAIVNTYYFGRLQNSNPDIALTVFWPNQQDRGVHVNVSGAGITKASKNVAAAQSLLEWLSADEAQSMLAGMNMEYPVNPDVAVDQRVKAWGEFKSDDINLAEMAAQQTEAVKLMDRAGYR